MPLNVPLAFSVLSEFKQGPSLKQELYGAIYFFYTQVS